MTQTGYMPQASTAPPARRARASVSPPDVHAVAPALAYYTDEVLFGDVWERTELRPRDRSMVTVTALIGGGHVQQMKNHFNRALDNGVTPRELGGIITHLAFYAGWPKARSAIGVTKDIFAQRGVSPADVADDGSGLPADAHDEAGHEALLGERIGGVAPALVRYTLEVLRGDLWRRTDLSPRDRSLVTISALIAAGQTEQLTSQMERGLANGLTTTEIAEIITHLAFYAGWPRAMSAIQIAKSLFAARPGG